MRSFKILFNFILVMTYFLPFQAYAFDAKPFFFQNEEQKNIDGKIDLRKDYFTVNLVAGNLFFKKGPLEHLFGEEKNLVVSITVQTKLRNNKDIQRIFVREIGYSDEIKIRAPIGMNPILLNNIPGENEEAVIKIQFVSHQDGRLTEMIKGMEKSTPTKVALNSVEWFGYAKLGIELLEKLFNASKNKREIFGNDLTIQNSIFYRQSKYSFKPHYIALIAPNDSDERFINNIESKDLSFKNSNLYIRGVPFNDRSYLVLEIRKGRKHDLMEKINRSQEPWSLLAHSLFIGRSTKNYDKNKETAMKQIKSIGEEYIKGLNNIRDLLIKTPRYGWYDITIGLIELADFGLLNMGNACDKTGISLKECPTHDLTLFINKQKKLLGIKVKLVSSEINKAMATSQQAAISFRLNQYPYYLQQYEIASDSPNSTGAYTNENNSVYTGQLNRGPYRGSGMDSYTRAYHKQGVDDYQFINSTNNKFSSSAAEKFIRYFNELP